jgi:hypothetical protein
MLVFTQTKKHLEIENYVQIIIKFSSKKPKIKNSSAKKSVKAVIIKKVE